MLGVPFRVIVPDIAEPNDGDADPTDNAIACARRKASMAVRIANASDDTVGLLTLPVLGIDTEVILDGVALGKPDDDEHARAMLRRLSGHSIEVISGLALIEPSQGSFVTASALSVLTVDTLGDAAIDEYLATGDHMDKAGALAVQGAAKEFVTVVDGTRSNVYGLPLPETAGLLAGVGIAVRQRRGGAL